MKQTVWYVIVIATTLLVLILLWQFSISIVLFALSLAVAAALRPIINDIAVKTRSKRFALGLVYSLVVLTILAVLVVGGQHLLRDLQTATDDFATSYERVKDEWPQEESLFRRTVAEQLPSADDLYQAMTSEEGILIMTEGGGLGDFFSSFGYIAIILVLSMYWSADQLRFERLTVSLFPTEHRPKALHVLRTVEKGVGAYLRSELLQSLLAGLILGVGYYWLIGLRYSTLLAVWVGVVRLIPWFGVLIAILPLLFLGIGSDPFSSILAVLYTVIVLLALRAVIEPRVMDQRRNNSLVIVLFVVILAEAFGFIGVLLAPPLAVAVQILLSEVYPLFAHRYSQELHQAFELKKRLSRLRRRVKSSGSSESMRLVNQLYQLVRQTITYMQKY